MKVIDVSDSRISDWDEYLHCWPLSRGWLPINGCWNCFCGRNKLRQC